MPRLRLPAALLLASLAIAPTRALRGQPAPPAGETPGARLARLKEAAQKDLDNPRVWVVLGRECILQKKVVDAIQFLEEALKRGSAEPKLRYHLAVLYRNRKQDQKASSLLTEQLALHPEDTESRRLLLELGAPACPGASVDTLDEFKPIAYAERCYDLQAAVNRGLATYNLEKGARLALLPANSEKVVADLAKYGYLEYPAHEPSRKQFLTDVRGRVTCPLHGSPPPPCREGKKPPRLERVKVPAGVLRSALASGDINLKIEAAAVVGRGGGPLDVLAEGLETETDRETLDAIFSAVEQAAHGYRSSVLEKKLSALQTSPAPAVRSGAARALFSMGARPKLPLDDAFGLLAQNARGDCPNDFLQAVFGGLGPPAAPRLAETLAKGDGLMMVPLLRAMERVKDRRVVEALIEALGRTEQVFEFYRSDIRHTLALLSGQDLGSSPGPWKEWVQKAYPGH